MFADNPNPKAEPATVTQTCTLRAIIAELQRGIVSLRKELSIAKQEHQEIERQQEDIVHPLRVSDELRRRRAQGVQENSRDKAETCITAQKQHLEASAELYTHYIASLNLEMIKTEDMAKDLELEVAHRQRELQVDLDTMSIDNHNKGLPKPPRSGGPEPPSHGSFHEKSKVRRMGPSDTNPSRHLPPGEETKPRQVMDQLESSRRVREKCHAIRHERHRIHWKNSVAVSKSLQAKLDGIGDDLIEVEHKERLVQREIKEAAATRKELVASIKEHKEPLVLAKARLRQRELRPKANGKKDPADQLLALEVTRLQRTMSELEGQVNQIDANNQRLQEQLELHAQAKSLKARAYEVDMQCLKLQEQVVFNEGKTHKAHRKSGTPWSNQSKQTSRHTSRQSSRTRQEILQPMALLSKPMTPRVPSIAPQPRQHVRGRGGYEPAPAGGGILAKTARMHNQVMTLQLPPKTVPHKTFSRRKVVRSERGQYLSTLGLDTAPNPNSGVPSGQWGPKTAR